MELLNYSTANSLTSINNSSRRLEVDNLMKLVSPSNTQSNEHLIEPSQNIGNSSHAQFHINNQFHSSSNSSLMPTPPNQQKSSQQQPSQIQPQFVQDHSDAATDYDYKESYSYMMNHPGNTSVEHYSPENSSFNLPTQEAAARPPQPQNIPSVSSVPANAGLPLMPSQHVQHSSPSSSDLHPENVQGRFIANQFNSQPIPHIQSTPDDFKPSKQHSLPEIRPTVYGSHEDEPFKYRANSCPVSYHIQGGIPQNQSQPQQQPHPLEMHQHQMMSIHVPQGLDVNQYPDMTTMLNSNSNLLPPPVESQFVDHKLCQTCGKRITRDMSRHMRTHQTESRFLCKFPKSVCRHKSGRFNRPYDYKKHLLNRHFKFDDPCVKRLHNLNDKLFEWGTCPCGVRFIGKDWLDGHILTPDIAKKCPCIE